MFLYVVRHGPAGLRDEQLWPDDTLRPLTKSGVRSFKQAARGLSRVVRKVDLMFSSPSLRAWQTADILSEVAKWPAPVAVEQLRVGPPGDVLSFLAQYDSQESIAVVGHEPYLGRLASAILTPGATVPIDFKKGGAIALEVTDVQSMGSPTLRWYLPPRVLRRLGE